jgi:hypothetical protein
MDWITDRLPTERDADGYGNVRIPKYPADLPDKSRDGSRVYQHYSLIIPGQPWWSRWAVQATPASVEPPAPPAERKIKQFAYIPKTEDKGEKVIALCNDGSLWYASPGWLNWLSFAPIPQPESQS